jgi:hypothetical protein
MNTGNISVEIRWANKPGNVKAYADLRLTLPEGTLQLRGFSVIVQPGKSAWVGFPAKPGSTSGKFFPVVEADGMLKERISNAILDSYQNAVRQ